MSVVTCALLIQTSLNLLQVMRYIHPSFRLTFWTVWRKYSRDSCGEKFDQQAKMHTVSWERIC